MVGERVPDVLEAKRRIGFFLTLGILFAAIAAWIAHARVTAVERQLGESVPVYVAAVAIPAQAPLSAQDFTTVSIPKNFLQPSMVTEKTAFEGKVSLVALNPGDLLTKQMLNSRFVVPEGFRTVRFYRSQTVLFDDNLQVGDSVDMVVTSVDADAQRAEPVTHRHLESLLVVETDPRGDWVALLVEEDQSNGVVQMQHVARQIQLLRLSPIGGGAKQ